MKHLVKHLPTLLALAQLAGLLLFLSGFLLTKVEVTQRSHQACPLPGAPAFDKVVWLVMDGLRFDQVGSQPLSCSARSHRAFSILQDLACELVRSSCH